MSDATEIQVQPAKDPKAKIKVKLKKAHTHAGTAYEPGQEIEVTQAQAEWLKAQGVI
jgi:hypothetical protein